MEHYFSPAPQAAHRVKTIAETVAGRVFSFQTDQAVFAKDRVDFGSLLLLNTFLKDNDKDCGRLLDLGCGYGFLGIVIGALRPKLDLVMADINARAVDLARQNLILNRISNACVIESDGFLAVDGDFDLIVTNPPVRAGKQTVFRLFTQAALRLNSGGQFYLVIQRKQGADSYYKKLNELFPQVRVAGKKAGYRVIVATK